MLPVDCTLQNGKTNLKNNRQNAMWKSYEMFYCNNQFTFNKPNFHNRHYTASLFALKFLKNVQLSKIFNIFFKMKTLRQIFKPIDKKDLGGLRKSITLSLWSAYSHQLAPNIVFFFLEKLFRKFT